MCGEASGLLSQRILLHIEIDVVSPETALVLMNGLDKQSLIGTTTDKRTRGDIASYRGISRETGSFVPSRLIHAS